MSAKILVVDDEPDLASLIRQKFRTRIRNHELEFIFAGHGQEALDLLQSHPDIDVMFTDIRMPVMDGLTLLMKFKELQILTKAVVMSAFSDMVNIRTAMNRGAFDFLTKPIDFEDLEITLHKTLYQVQHMKATLEQKRIAQQARQRAEEALHESERRLATFLEALPVGVCVVDSEGTLCYANQTAQILVGQGLASTIAPESFSEVCQVYLAGTDQLYPPAQRPILRALKGESVTVEDIELHQEGQVLPLEMWATPIYDHQGEVVYAIAAFQDITQRKRAEQIRSNFGRYLTDEVVSLLLEKPESLKLGGDCRTITILTSDLRGFTALSERLPPEEVITILNIYLATMTDVIAQYQGTIDDFIGDGILVLFGAPIAREDDAQRAVACAIAMQLAMETVNAKLQRPGWPCLDMGIGLNTGTVVMGNIGSEKRCKFSVIGSTVNLAYRIESNTTGGQIFISASTYKAVEAIVQVYTRKEVRMKGVQEPIAIYDVKGIRGSYNLFLPDEAEIFWPLTVEIPLQYQLVDDKRINELVFKGSLVKLSKRGAEIRAEQDAIELSLSGLCDLQLHFMSEENSSPKPYGTVYAKVLDKPAEAGRFCVHFTSLCPLAGATLDALYASLTP
jgi:PAS domain S-box-containing protein